MKYISLFFVFISCTQVESIPMPDCDNAGTAEPCVCTQKEMDALKKHAEFYKELAETCVHSKVKR